MPELTESAVRELLGQISDPETGRPLGSLGQVVSADLAGQQLKAQLGISTHSRPIEKEFADEIESKLVAAFPGLQVELDFVDHARPAPRVGQTGLRAKSVIAVGSGKGGVGKSTVAASIALTLRSLGSKVGLMDADVYGPSIPHLLGLSGRPAFSESKRIDPIRLDSGAGLHPMPVMSMGFLVDPNEAVIWRGPMLHGSINQFLGMTEWGELDYLIIDMPPGTGDVALTLSQAIPLAGSVVVCTPQEVALLDAVKAVAMFRKVNIPILGMVENMSGFQCPDCAKTYDIFGSGGARERAESLQIPFLGQLPIQVPLREAGDEGRLAGELEENGAVRAPFEAIVKAMVGEISRRSVATPKKPSLPTL